MCCFIQAKRGYSIYLGSYENPVCLFHDKTTGYEVEVWTRPDGVEWDIDTLERRREFGVASVKVWVISPGIS